MGTLVIEMATQNPAAYLPVLRPVSLFQGLRKATLLEIAKRTTEESYPAGVTVIREGDAGDSLCIVASGNLTVHRNGEAVATMTAGDYFGEISLIDGRPRSATIVADDDVVLLQLGAADFEALLAIPFVSRAVMQNLASIVRHAPLPHTSHCP